MGNFAEDVRQRLFDLAEDGYREFQTRLVPESHSILGVRMPHLRKLAKEISAADWQGYLHNAPEEYHEELLLKALVISNVKAPLAEILPHIKAFIPKIDNWAVCDVFFSDFKIVKKEPEFFWGFIQPYFLADEEFQQRFACVMLLGHFTDEKHLYDGLALLEKAQHPGYYVKMAVAWAVSAYYTRFPEQVETWLKQCQLEDWTYNKSLQKITESLRIRPEQREKIKSMKRKKQGKNQ